MKNTYTHLLRNEAVGWAILALCMTLLLSSCRSPKTITIEKPVYIHDTAKFVKEVRDSVYIDKWHEVYVKGDTVYDVREKTIVKWAIRTDTAYKVVERPVEVVKEQIKEVEKDNPPWYRIMFFVGLMTTCLFIAFVLSKILNFDKKK